MGVQILHSALCFTPISISILLSDLLGGFIFDFDFLERRTVHAVMMF